MKKAYLILLLAAVLVLSSCGWSKKKLGLTKAGPDETLVQTNNPLVLPPEFNVRPKVTANSEEDKYDSEKDEIKND